VQDDALWVADFIYGWPAEYSARSHVRACAIDSRRALALTRGLEPELSTDPADYLVSSFRFKNEAYGDAEIGVSLRLFALETFFAR
jgi:hypothetical protein